MHFASTKAVRGGFHRRAMSAHTCAFGTDSAQADTAHENSRDVEMTASSDDSAILYEGRMLRD